MDTVVDDAVVTSPSKASTCVGSVRDGVSAVPSPSISAPSAEWVTDTEIGSVEPPEAPDQVSGTVATPFSSATAVVV